MKRIEIKIGGASYPCYQTAGAMLRFKDLTGKEVTEIKGNELSSLIRFLWCCTVSACKREDIQFPLSLMEFADAIDPDQMEAWQQDLNAETAAPETDGQKKSPSA